MAGPRRAERYPRARRLVQRLVERTPYRVSRRFPLDADAATIATVERVTPFSLCTAARLVETVRATEYVARAGLPGALVECGVWRGGNVMAIALTLQRLGCADRELYLYDTFEGMSEPTDGDVRHDGAGARQMWEANREHGSNRWTRAPLEEVRAAVESTGYDPGLIRYVKGRVEETLPLQAPEQVALLRLDTDFYESTLHELEHLYPRLERGGVLIVDDYGSWQGARKAVDEYVARSGIRLFLSTTDASGRSAVKQ